LTLKYTVGLVFIANGALQDLCMYVCISSSASYELIELYFLLFELFRK